MLLQVAGNKVALVAVGAILPVATLVAWARLTALDRTAVAPAQLARIEAVPMFAPLPVATKEQLARRLEQRDVPAGTVVVRAGDFGDSFYLVGEGELEVLVPGEEPRHSRAGDYFGEIALLRDVPRTATVRALTDSTLFVLGRDNFLTAVTGHEAGHAAGEHVVATRLGEAALVTGELADDDVVFGHTRRAHLLPHVLRHLRRA